jgi:hypothetical protein
LLRAVAVGRGRVGMAAGHQPAAPPSRRARDQQLSGVVPPAHQRGTVRRAVGGGARSVLRRYSDAWFQAAKRRNQQQDAGFPRRKRALVPVRCYHGTFTIQGKRVRLPVARSQPELWVRLARPIPYTTEQVRAVTLLHDGRRLWLAVTAAVPIQQDHDLDPNRVAGVDLGIIHPYAVVTEDAGLLVSGRALRANSSLPLKDQQARHAKAARRAQGPGSVGRAAGAATDPGSVVPRRAIAAASTRPSMRPPERSSPSPSSSGSAPWWSATPRASPSKMRAGCRTGGCGGGTAPTLCKRCGTRPSRRGWWCGWWTSVAPPPPARVAGSASPSPRAAGSAVRNASSTGTGIWSVPTTSPPRSAADPRALSSRCSSSTVGPASCRHGVTAAATSMMIGGGGPAWPRATQGALVCPVGVARQASPTWRLARIKQRRPTGPTLLEGHYVQSGCLLAYARS